MKLFEIFVVAVVVVSVGWNSHQREIVFVLQLPSELLGGETQEQNLKETLLQNKKVSNILECHQDSIS